VVEYHSFQMVGSASERRIDVRVVAATNADLRLMCRKGDFLADLWDRLSFEIIELPPLRDRPGDVSLLAHYFGARMASELGRGSSPVLSPEALAALEAYGWPGNVRELKNVIERAVYRFEGDGAVIGLGDLQLESGLYNGQPEAPAPNEPNCLPGEAAGLPGAIFAPRIAPWPNAQSSPPAPAPSSALGFEESLRRYAASLLEAAMEASGRHQGKAAELLGLSYHKFRALRRKYLGNE
jgi:psp operon transcriptional activator